MRNQPTLGSISISLSEAFRRIIGGVAVVLALIGFTAGTAHADSGGDHTATQAEQSRSSAFGTGDYITNLILNFYAPSQLLQVLDLAATSPTTAERVILFDIPEILNLPDGRTELRFLLVTDFLALYQQEITSQPPCDRLLQVNRNGNEGLISLGVIDLDARRAADLQVGEDEYGLRNLISGRNHSLTFALPNGNFQQSIDLCSAAQPTIDLPPVPLLAIQPSSLSFGDLEIGNNSDVLFTTLRNTGSAELQVSSITGIQPPFSLQLSSCGDFVDATVSAFTLPPNGDCQLGFRFAPTFDGEASADVTVNSDSVSGTGIISLSGTGLAAEISASPSNIEFETEVVGEQSVSKTITVLSNGRASLFVNAIFITGPAAEDFALIAANDECTGSTLLPEESCIFEVVFTPSNNSPRQATILIDSNAVKGTGQINLQGTTNVLFFDGFEGAQ